MIEVPFSEVNSGERFTSRKSKRYFVGVKIAPTEVSSKGTVQESDGPTYTGNAVILGDGFVLAHDARAIIIMDENEVVEVLR